MSDLLQFADVTEMREALERGLTTSLALVEAALARIEAEDGAIRAFIQVNPAARDLARASDARRAAGAAGPLEGIPFAVKDNIAAEGLVLSDGTWHYRERIAKEDAEVLRRLKAAGAINLGKLNMHEGALGATNDNPFWGQCQNPLQPGYTPGGSSGGSAAAIAAGFVPFSLGTDTMGSVRIPAAYCGLWALKPSRGVISRHGLSHLSWTLDTIGPLARSGRDLALLAPLMIGQDIRDPDSRPLPAQSPRAAQRIAVLQLDPATLEPEVAEAFSRFLAGLRARGYQIEELALPDWQPSKLRRAGLLVSEAEGAITFADALAQESEGLSSGFRAMLRYGQKQSAERLAAAYAALRETTPLMAAVLQRYDLVLTPTAPQRAFAHGAPVPVNQADHTALANCAGLPAVALPLLGEGLPHSVQLIGAWGSDLALIEAARELAA